MNGQKTRMLESIFHRPGYVLKEYIKSTKNWLECGRPIRFL